MQNNDFPESDQLLDARRIEKAQVHGLRTLLRLILFGLPWVFALSLWQGSGGIQLGIVGAALVLAAVAYALLVRGQHLWSCYTVVFLLLACSAGGIVAYGSVRSALVLGFAAAIVTAGMRVGKKALIVTVAASAALLGSLTWLRRILKWTCDSG
jgi:hypothetical protein